MAQDQPTETAANLFARKGGARAASGLRLLEQQAGHTEPVQLRAGRAAADGVPLETANAPELGEAASLGPGGFTEAERRDAASDAPAEAAPRQPEHVSREPEPVAPEAPPANASSTGPADIDNALAEIGQETQLPFVARLIATLPGDGIARRLLISVGFIAALLACVGVGYGISVLVRGGATQGGAVIAGKAMGLNAPQHAPSDGAR